MVDILETLQKTALAKSSLIPEALTLRGVWRTEYVLKINDNASRFHLHYLVAQTLGQGSSYFDPSIEQPVLDESLIGDNALKINSRYRCINIATLDAVFASLKGPPDEAHIIKGSNIEKADQRASIVCNEALSLLKRSHHQNNGSAMKVLNVGVVGNFLAILSKQRRLDVKATDYYPGIVGGQVCGVQVEHGSKTLELVADADLAIVTGMTLATNTLDSILETALKHKTALLIFAETGANFAAEYCKMGIDVVVSEPFPTYLTCSGETQIDVYRKSD